MSEKKTARNLFENRFVIPKNNIKSSIPSSEAMTDKINESPIHPSIMEMITEIMKAKYDIDMDAIRQETVESKELHELVEELRKEIRNLSVKLENIEQENRMLTSMVSKIKDIDTNVLTCQKNIEKITQETVESKELHELVEELRKEIRNLSVKLENIEQEKEIQKEKNNELVSIGNSKNIVRQEKQSIQNMQKNKIKNDGMSFTLSVILGLIGLSGIAHIYLGKVLKGIGILTLSLVILGAGLFFVIMPESHNILENLHLSNSFGVFFLAGYLGLYIYQIFDARKMCKIYNNYHVENGKSPPWW